MADLEALHAEVDAQKRLQAESAAELDALLPAMLAGAKVRLAIEDTLDAGLPRAYTPELYHAKCSGVFEHFYESYPDRDVNIYAAAV